jgi:hypothetical protein
VERLPILFHSGPGLGTVRLGKAESDGAQRTDVAAELFRQKKAPLIIVSGGHVHPMQTPYCEAIEMKKYLIEKYKISETRFWLSHTRVIRPQIFATARVLHFVMGYRPPWPWSHPVRITSHL